MALQTHGSSEGHEMLKRNNKYHSIADDVPIPKMYFLSKSVDGLFQKLHFCVWHDIFFFSGLAELSVGSQAGFFKSHWIVDKEGTISAAKINAQ